MSRQDRHQRAYERTLDTAPKKQGLFIFDECFVCGFMELGVIYHDRPDGFEVRPMSHPSECPRCSEVMRRDPELGSWVLAVVNTRTEPT